MTAGRRESRRAAKYNSRNAQLSSTSAGAVTSASNPPQQSDGQRFTAHIPGQRRPQQIETLRLEIRRALQARASQLDIEIRENDFQIDAAAELMAGRDVMVSTATGTGKTMCFQIPVITRLTSIVLVICPLLSLMDDQVHSAIRLGIKACAVTYNNQLHDPGLVTSIAKGKYQLVFVSPEFCSPDNNQFLEICGQTAFAERLVGIAIDEAHLCHAWQSFRPRYAFLHLLRHYFPEVGVMAVSATMTPYVRRFIHSSTNMTPGTRLIRRPIDRPNIYLAAIPLKHSTKSFKDLSFILDRNPHHPVEIPQTIVFMDNRREACKACTKLWSQTPPDWLQNYPMALADVSTGLGDPRRTFVMKAFKQGVCRVLFATDVAGMGIDFPSVRRVIQWRVTPTLTISALWQRFGRCVRDPMQQGVAMIFYSARCVIPETGEPLSVLGQPARPETVAPILRLIEDYATGKPESTARQHDPLDLEAPSSVSTFHLDESVLDEAPAANGSVALAECGEALYDDLELDEFDFDDFDLDDLDIASQDGQPLRSPLAEGDLSDEQEEDDGSEYEDAADDTGGTVRKTGKRERKFRPPGTCRGVLWFINTPRCRRETILQVFDEPDFDQNNFDIPSPVVASEHRGNPCCDRHVPLNCLPASLRGLLPPDSCTADEAIESDFDGSSSDSDEEGAQAAESRRSCEAAIISKDAKRRLCEDLKALRQDIWLSKGYAHIYSPYPAYKLLPDHHIKELIKQFSSLRDADSMCDVLAAAHMPIHPAWQEITSKQAFWTILESYKAIATSQAAPTIRDRRRSPGRNRTLEHGQPNGQVGDTQNGEAQLNAGPNTTESQAPRSQRIRHQINYYPEDLAAESEVDEGDAPRLAPAALAIAEEPSPTSTVVPVVNVEKPKRKRGRPRKSDTAAQVSTEKRDRTPPELNLPKRKRGRPSKKDVAEREALKAAALLGGGEATVPEITE
jgi:hypothetical protein